MNYEPTDKPQWYVLHTYSGYENRVKNDLESAINNQDLNDEILEIKIPVQKVVEEKDGKEVTRDKKLFPGYVMVRMFLSDDIWYMIRNVRGVTGFVGPEAKPIPLKEEELVRMGLIEETKKIPKFKVGDQITVIAGPFEGVKASIEEVIPAQSKVRVNVPMFGGRLTSTELEFSQIQKINKD